jgi:TPR repeat protein
LLYEFGTGVPQDYAQAAVWHRKAAQQGLAEGQFNLGLLYFTGHGVPQDYAEAYFWFDVAAAGNCATANRCLSELTKAVLLQTQERARKWFEAHPAKPQ